MAGDLVDRDLACLWHPCSQMRDYRGFPPLPVASARGCRLVLEDGREVLDAIASWWCKSLGHGHPGVDAALRAQLGAFSHVILANTTNAPVVRLCERLLAAANGHGSAAWGPQAPAGRLPGWFGKVFFADNGSTAVEVALKMALQAQFQGGAPQRTRFAALANGYHGETVGALAVSDLGLYGAPYRSLLPEVAKLAPVPWRSGPDDPRWQDCGAEWPALQAQLDAQADSLAAVVYEPVLQGAGGMRPVSPDLLRRLRAWADRQGVLLIADEIAAGLGRCGAMLASHLAAAGRTVSAGPGDHLGCLPDFAVVSKGLTAGTVPQAAVLATDRLYDRFDGEWAERRAFLHSNTYAGNALAVAAANAALDAYAAEGILGRVAGEGPGLRARLAALAAARPCLRGVRGVGMVAAVDLRGRDGAPLPAEARTGWRVYQAAVRRGALLRPLGDTMYLFPPLNASAVDIDAMAGILAHAIDEVLPA